MACSSEETLPAISQQQVWIKLELTRESNRGCFTWRRFQTSFDLGQVRGFDSDAVGDLA